MGAIQRGTSWATIPKTLNRARTVRQRPHRAYLSAKLNMYPNRQFLAHFVVHMPLCLHVLFRAAVFCIVIGGGGVTFGIFPRGYEYTVVCRRLVCKGEVGYMLRSSQRKGAPPQSQLFP